MGIEITSSCFDEDECSRFEDKLDRNIEALGLLLQQDGFGQPSANNAGLGAELEMYIIDQQGQPLSVNQEILVDAADPQLTLELNRYNLEYNLTPYVIKQSAFESTEKEILKQLDRLNQLAGKYQGRVVAIGILPTLQAEHFGLSQMTDRERYHALVSQLIKRRGSNFQIDIKGEQSLRMEMSDVTLEGANTSFQVHYRIAPQNYADTFNAFQLVTPLVMALAANSPGIFGHNLWHETRIPLFKQSIDTRVKGRYEWHEPARVNFGHGWVRQSALELFQETASIYPPLLPFYSEDEPFQQMEQGIVPSLGEMRMHQSSVWLWNRPVYDDADGGHLRIEMRSLPAGPSAIDMVANAALYIGLAEYFRHRVVELLPGLPFHLAECNFYRAAQFGMDASIVWPDRRYSGCRQRPIVDVIEQCLPFAREGLESIGVSHHEIEKYMEVIERRLETRQTGAVWQQKTVACYQKNHSNPKSQQLMLEDYIANSASNRPVSEWDLI